MIQTDDDETEEPSSACSEHNKLQTSHADLKLQVVFDIG